MEQLLETRTRCEVTSNTNGVNSDVDTVHDDDDDDDVSEELTDTEDSDDLSNGEEED